MSRIVFLLDPAADAVLPDDATVLSSERAFLECAVQTLHAGRRYLVRGRALCKWVEDWSEGRGHEFEYLESPRAVWRCLCPFWTDAEISALQGQSGRPVPPQSLEDVLGVLYPTGPWQERPGLEHAACWALWLEECEIAEDAPARPLFRQYASRWRAAVEESDLLCQRAYALETASRASSFLEDWLLSGRMAKPFPLVVPAHWRELAEATWRFRPMEEGAAVFWSKIVSGTICRELRQIAARLVYDYLRCHFDEITDELLVSLRTSLSPDQWQALRKHRPPQFPSALSEHTSPSSVLQWVADEYLPFRQWQVLYGDGHHQVRAEQAAQQFADWLLSFYPEAIGGGRGNDALAITASATLLQRPSGVVLWVILDGMPVPDGARLLERLQEDPRLTLGENRLYFTTLPTITCFCKPALMNGRPPEHLDVTETPTPNFSGAVFLRDKTMRDEAAQAKAGQVLVWSHRDPDAIYHRSQSRETTLTEVDGKLQTLAEQIRELARAVPAQCELTVIVTTDHGRLLAEGVARTHLLPEGAKSEGRTAWGRFTANPPEGVVELSSERFRLPAGQTVWVLRDHAAFVQANGSGGTVGFPHGGLWPEEVIVPWFTLIRDARPPMLRIQIAGTGRAGGLGTLVLTIDNAGDTAVTIRLVQLRSADGAWTWNETMDFSVGEKQRETTERSVDRWPHDEECAQITGIVAVAQPNGVRFELAAKVALEANTLYQQSLDAADLLDL